MAQPDPFDLTGKVAIITGSSRGIGKAIAELYASRGCRVVISSRNLDACKAVAEDINRIQGAERALAIAASISSKEALRSLVAETEKAFGTIDILVCNAASNPYYGSMDGVTDEQFRKTLDNNILSNHWLIQMVLPRMRAAREGSVIVVSSIAGLQGRTDIGVYGISKAADLQLVRNYAKENGEHNIRFNAIAPGLIRTQFAGALLDNPEWLDRVAHRSALQRIGEPSEIAGPALFLASRASAFMTGQVMVIDGGTIL